MTTTVPVHVRVASIDAGSCVSRHTCKYIRTQAFTLSRASGCYHEVIYKQWECIAHGSEIWEIEDQDASRFRI